MHRDPEQVEVDVAFPTGDEQSASLVLDAAGVRIAELEAERDAWKERAERAEARLQELDPPA